MIFYIAYLNKNCILLNTFNLCIISIDEFLKQIQFGCINGKSIPCLTALVSTLFGPLFMDDTTVQDSM